MDLGRTAHNPTGWYIGNDIQQIHYFLNSNLSLCGKVHSISRDTRRYHKEVNSINACQECNDHILGPGQILPSK